MDVTPLIRANQNVIQSYTKGVFKISSVIYNSPVIVAPDMVNVWKIPNVRGVSDLKLEHFYDLIKTSDNIDVMLLGSGAKMNFLPRELKVLLKENGLKIDVMDTGAACRTYNVLMADGRRVVCALLPFKKE